MNRLLICLLALAVTGCSTLRVDPVAVSAIEANYPTAEFRACNKLWHGLGVCSVRKGELYSKIDLKIQGYFSGVVVIDSKDCGIEIRKEYSNSELISFQLPGIANRNCELTMTITPKYPDQDDHNIQVHNFRGHLAIRVLEHGRSWEWRTQKVTGNFSSEMNIRYAPLVSAKVVAGGCDREEIYNQVHYLDDEYFSFNLNEMIPVTEKPKVCVLEGFLSSEIVRDLDFNILVAKYDKRFTQLPIPKIEMDDDEITIVADEAVSVISMDDQYEIGHEVEFDFDKTKKHVIRLLTMKGRSIIGLWIPGNGGWEWVQ